MEFLNLPSYLASSVLSSWVEVQNVARLDTTYCNHTLRPRLLAALRSPEVVLSKTGRTHGFKTPTAWMKWHTQRDVKASELVLARNVGDVFSEISASFIAAVGGSRGSRSQSKRARAHTISDDGHELQVHRTLVRI
jgi:hypothetical protein